MPILKSLVSLVDTIDKNTGLSENIDKPYLLLLVPIGIEPDPVTNEYTNGEFNVVRGRRDAYNLIKESFIDFYDLTKSFILSGNISFGNEVTLYTFLRLCIEKYKYDTEDYLMEINERITSSNSDITIQNLNMLYVSELGAKAS